MWWLVCAQCSAEVNEQTGARCIRLATLDVARRFPTDAREAFRQHLPDACAGHVESLADLVKRAGARVKPAVQEAISHVKDFCVASAQ
jgi:hypothetical protein